MEEYEIYKRAVALGLGYVPEDRAYISLWKWLSKERSIDIKVGPGYSWEFQFGDSIYKSSKVSPCINLKTALLEAIELALNLLERE